MSALEAAEDTGFRIAGPMALVLTDRRLLSFKIGSPIGLGIGGRVKELVGAAPLAQVDSIEVRRLAMGSTITLSVRSTSFVLEANARADSAGLAAAFASARAAAGAQVALGLVAEHDPSPASQR